MPTPYFSLFMGNLRVLRNGGRPFGRLGRDDKGLWGTMPAPARKSTRRWLRRPCLFCQRKSLRWHSASRRFSSTHAALPLFPQGATECPAYNWTYCIRTPSLCRMTGKAYVYQPYSCQFIGSKYDRAVKGWALVFSWVFLLIPFPVSYIQLVSSQ